jgi:hypothetical protein
VKEGRVAAHAGKPRQPDADEGARLAVEAADREEALRKAEDIRLQMQRRAIFLQENPPTQDWLEPPRYELS